MIVDDNAAFLAAARAILEGRELTIVAEAGTAQQALQCVHEVHPDLVLIDIDLGEDSGFSVARQLSENRENARPKLILISAHPQDDFADLIADSPVLGFIPKSDLSPATVRKLLSHT